MNGRGEKPPQRPSNLGAIAQNDSGLEVYPSDFLFLRHLHAAAMERGGGSGEGRLRASHCREPITPFGTPVATQAGPTLHPRCLPQGDFSLRSLFALLAIWFLSGDPGHQIHA